MEERRPPGYALVMDECEIKIPVTDLVAVESRLRRAGGRRLCASATETNVLFDTAQGELTASGRVLRLRRVAERAVLTYKGPATMDGAVKRRHEIEVEVPPGARLLELLGALGFEPSVRYAKRRERWQLGAVEVDLDHTPIGDFVELEGAPEELGETARRLGLDLETAVPESYIELWQNYRRTRPELGRDMIFE